MMHRQKKFTDNMQTCLWQQKMDVGNPASIRIFNRNHRQIGFSFGLCTRKSGVSST